MKDTPKSPVTYSIFWSGMVALFLLVTALIQYGLASHHHPDLVSIREYDQMMDRLKSIEKQIKTNGETIQGLSSWVEILSRGDQ